MKSENKTKTIYSVAGGKGGVGKSIFSVALGATLANQGHTVALVDLDLGAANLHTSLGIITKTPTIADFILKRVTTLEELLLDTSLTKLKLISGADFVPGMANPAHWMKLKIMRHIKALPADFVIIDLGAGVHFNTLDFFSMSDKGVVITAPEPGAVMNAYSFIKGALYRKLQGVFKKHPDIGPVIEGKINKTDDEKKFSLAWLYEKVKELSPDMLPVIDEIEKGFSPALVVNRTTGDQKHVLIYNLLTLCSTRLGIHVEYLGNLPDTPDISNHLLNIPGFLKAYSGKSYAESVKNISAQLLKSATHGIESDNIKREFSDDDLEQLAELVESLDSSLFEGTNKNSVKLRLYFKPREAVQYLINRGVNHQSFYR